MSFKNLIYLTFKSSTVFIQLHRKIFHLGAKNSFDALLLLFREFQQQEKQNPICLPDSTNHNQGPLNKEAFVWLSQLMPDIKSCCFPMVRSIIGEWTFPKANFKNEPQFGNKKSTWLHVGWWMLCYSDFVFFFFCS